MSTATAPRVRTSGGFNQSLGSFNDGFEKHLDDNAMQAAVQQKALAQQAATPTSAQASAPTSGAATQADSPREIGSVKDELLVRPGQDIARELMAFFDVNRLLEINSTTDTPEQQAHKRQLWQRYQKLDQEDQQAVKAKYQQRLKEKQAAEQAEQAKAEQAEQAKAQTLVMPSSPSKGPIGPGGPGKKPAAVQKLEQDRKTLGGPKSVN